MKLSDLCTLMRVTLRSGKTGIVGRGLKSPNGPYSAIMFDDSWMDLTSYNEDMCLKTSSEGGAWDIMKVEAYSGYVWYRENEYSEIWRRVPEEKVAYLERQVDSLMEVNKCLEETLETLEDKLYEQVSVNNVLRTSINSLTHQINYLEAMSGEYKETIETLEGHLETAEQLAKEYEKEKTHWHDLCQKLSWKIKEMY